ARIVDAFTDATVGAATGKLFRAKGYDIVPTEEIDSLGIRMTRSGRHFDMTTATGNDVFGVSGAAAVYRKSFIIDVTINNEYFDEDFFAYREDADVAWRGRLLVLRAML